MDKTSVFKGFWKSDTSPWVREIMEVFADNSVQDMSIMCSAQSAKTQTIMCLLAWAISEDPGPCMWVMAAQDEAKTFSRTRLMPTLEECGPVAAMFPVDRWQKSTLEINFTSMPLILNGANSQSKLQSKPVRWLFLDEVRNYPPGALEMVLKRTRGWWNARRLIVSTPGLKDDAVHRAFMAGDQRYLHVRCLGCGEFARMDWKHWENLKWDTNGDTFRNGRWNFDALESTIRWECLICGHKTTDTPSHRKAIANSGKWIPENPTAPTNRKSWNWGSLIVPWISWRELVEEFLMGKDALKMGNIEPFKSFVNESMGWVWEDQPAESDITDLQNRVGTFASCEKWEGERRRFLTADVQRDMLYYVCRAWGAMGESRLISHGRVWTLEELREKQTALGVADGDVGIDSGYQTAAVYQSCAKWGWKAFKGEDVESFQKVLPDGRKVRSIYRRSQSEISIAQTGGGQFLVRLFLWSNPATKDMLALFTSGKGAPWWICSDATPDYFQQMTGEVRVQKTSPQGMVKYLWKRIGDNHYFDCELMNMVAAVISGIIRKGAEVVEDVKPGSVDMA